MLSLERPEVATAKRCIFAYHMYDYKIEDCLLTNSGIASLGNNLTRWGSDYG